MGEVYRARDEQLGRDVALKVVGRAGAGSERVARFLREARAAAALTHPNVLVVHDVGEQDGVPYLVSELLVGETLRQRLDREGRLSPRLAVAIGVQVLRGLAVAHAAGIVHRDLKPENLFLMRDGRAKILDFGVARLLGGGPDDLLTASDDLTAPGTAIGTVAYMSPEQVRGQAVDARSDLWSFGAVLYELLAGRHAFRGDTNADTMSAILAADPLELGAAGAAVPSALERAILHCLEKQPEARFQSASDVAFALENASVSSAEAAAPDIGKPKRGRRAALASLLVGAGALALGTVAFRAGRGGAPAPGPSWTVERLTELPGEESQPAISPDGKSVVYVRDDDLWLVRVGGSHAIALTPASPSRDFAPAFSPDGQWLAFNSERGGGGIFVMGATGENVRRVTRRGFRPAWTPDGRELVYAFGSAFTAFQGEQLAEGLEAVDVASGRTRRLCDCVALAPAVSPHGRRVAYWGVEATGSSQRDLWTVPLAGLRPGERPVRVTNDASLDWNPQWSADGRTLEFVSDRGGSPNLWSLAIDEAAGAPRGVPQPRTLPSARVQQTSPSADGQVRVYVEAMIDSTLRRAELDLVGGEVVGGLREVFRLTHQVNGPSSRAFSPDGQMVALQGGPKMDDIVLLAVDGSQARTLVSGPFRCRAPVWSPDGRTIAFASDRGGRYEIWGIGVDGADLRVLMRSPRALLGPVWSADGKLLWAFEMIEFGAHFRPVLHRAGDPPEKLEVLPPLPDGDEFEGTVFSRTADTLIGYGTRGTLWRWWLRERRYELLLRDPSLVRRPDVELPDGRLLLRSQPPGVAGPRVIELFDPRSGRLQRMTAIEAPFGASVAFHGRTLWVMSYRVEADLWIARAPPPAR
jgi:Tol biopolymer transport system component